MSIDNVSSCSGNNDSATLQNVKQRFQDFQDLNQAVKSGDLTSAQSALTSFQDDIKNAPATSRLAKLFADGTQGSKDLQTLQDAITGNDPTGAQAAMAALKEDVRGTQKAHHGGHHHHVENDGDADDAAKTPTTGDTTSTGATTQVMPKPVPGSTLDVTA